MHAQTVRVAAAQDAVACAEIVAGLEDFFTDDVPDKVQHATCASMVAG